MQPETIEILKSINWIAVVNVIALVLFPVIGFLIKRARGKDKILQIARQAYVYVEAIAKSTPGALDDKLAAGMRLALAIAGDGLSEPEKAAVVEEIGRIAKADKPIPIVPVLVSGIKVVGPI